MKKRQKVVFNSAAITFLYLMGLLMYEIGLFKEVTFGLILLCSAIIGSCIFVLYLWVQKNEELIEKICTFRR